MKAEAKKTGDTSGLSAVDRLEAENKKKTASLKASLSPEDYKLSKLSKADRQRLIDSGAYTQKKFDGLDNYINNKKKRLGIAVKTTKTKTTKSKSTTKKTTGKKTAKKSSGSRKGSGTTKASNSKFAAALAAQNRAVSSNDKALRNLISKAKVHGPGGSGGRLKVAGVALKKQNVKKIRTKAVA